MGGRPFPCLLSPFLKRRPLERARTMADPTSCGMDRVRGIPAAIRKVQPLVSGSLGSRPPPKTHDHPLEPEPTPGTDFLGPDRGSA